jgi:chaperonin cofactor prefoldin
MCTRVVYPVQVYYKIKKLEKEKEGVRARLKSLQDELNRLYASGTKEPAWDASTR